MTPATPALVDTTLERMLVAALIADPSRHDALEIGIGDFADLQSRYAYGALASVRALGDVPTLETITARLVEDWLLAHHAEPDWQKSGYARETLAWVSKISETPLCTDPPVALWSSQLIVLAETRRGLLADAEPVPRARSARGPRADNTEPVRLAEAFRRYRHNVDGEPTLVRWARAWWRYDGTRYIEHDEESLDRDLIGFLDVVVAPQRSPKDETVTLRRVTSKQRTIAEVRKAALHVFPIVEGGAPSWTTASEGDPDPVSLVPCMNGILNLSTRELRLRTPRLFATTAIGAAWDPNAVAPTWMTFLSSLWGEDTDSIHSLQQMFGYFLTPDTSYQKLFALIGLPRSGKGTIARVLRALLGADAVVNPTLDGLENTFGLQPLIGRTLAIIGDARLGGAKDQAHVIERLLSISGEDSLLINQKYAGMVNVRLRTRVLLLSNELPRLYDTSGALASRFVILELRRSFLGHEDRSLEAKLLTELPGIFRWAVDGYESLAEEGRFRTSAVSEEAVAAMRDLGSPMATFLTECCRIESNCDTETEVLFRRYCEWCSENQFRDPGTKPWFTRNLHTLLPEVPVKQRTRGDGKTVRVYVGVGLSQS